MDIVEVPARRSDIKQGRSGTTSVLTDPVMCMTYAINPMIKAIWSILDRPKTVLELAHITGTEVAEIEVAVTFLLQRALLKTPHATYNEIASRDILRSLQEVSLSDVGLTYTPGLKHACQACGSCCSATDVGPVRHSVADDIRSANWSHIPALATGMDPFRKVSTNGPDGKPLLLLETVDDKCVFLSSGGACEVHAALGGTRKPTPCRQFPYVFTHTDVGIRVSLQMECRAYDRAKAAAPETSSQSTMLRELLQSGAPIHQLPTPLRAATGLLWGHHDYVRFESELIQSLRRACTKGTPTSQPFNVLVQTTRKAIQTLYKRAGMDASVPWYVENQDLSSLAGVSPYINIQTITDELTTFCFHAQSVAKTRRLPHLAQRFNTLGRALDFANEDVFDIRWDDPDAARSILTDLFVSGIANREVIRHCRDVQIGVAWLVLRSWLALAMAKMRAKEVCRVSCRTTDLIDSMVIVCKMLRERAVLEVIDGMKSRVTLAFLTNLEALTSDTAPQVINRGPGGNR